MREALLATGLGDRDPLVREAQDAKFGDFQCNVAMSVGKERGENPREVAQRIVAALADNPLFESVDIAGPGFINVRLKRAAFAQALEKIPPATATSRERLGIPVVSQPKIVVVDFSSPNLAKEMHVGHLRSTVIGDSLCRVLEFQGHTVLRENHVGDWGTQFGMLVAYLKETEPHVVANPQDIRIADLEAFYVAAKTRFDEDAAFQSKARETVVLLQKGDPATRTIWRAFCDESLRHCHEIYARLGIQLTDKGESVYEERMVEIVGRLEKLRDAGDAGVRDSDGALCVFMDGFKNRDGELLPLIVRKSDGGHNYATSDLATLVERVEHERAERIIYVVGLAQKQHFAMVFAAARQLGWVPADVSLEHIGFGNMLSNTGKPFKTREGGTVKLKALLDESVERARAIVSEQQDGANQFEPAEVESIGENVGLAAVKYFDLSHALQTDYRFDPDVMLAMDGNTAPYIMYAYARIRSIVRKAQAQQSAVQAASIELEHESELALAKQLAQFPDVVDVVGKDLRPVILVEYLFELAKTFSRFYDRNQGVRVIDATPEATKLSRLRLCDVTSRTLKLGLELLGIQTIERM